MNTTELKKFAQQARRLLIEQVSARLKLVLQMDSAEIREKEKAVNQLQEEIAKTSAQAVVERVAYIWFNRFCALRFMDVNRYSKVGTVSPAEGFSQPEILQEAKQGHINEDLQINTQKVFDLLGGKAVSTDPQQEAYRLLFVAVCNSYHSLMPFMFERIADFTELLMPDDLLSENSILHTTRNILTEENCHDVEVIGWLYQFYISEKKDQVFEGLKKNKKITPENIPAATQLFTPHWIVRYLVENSLGRLWVLNRPKSRLIEQMEYYIKPEDVETDFLKINSPEEIKICDPACGSGHMLTYAFDLLSAIYEEEGYDQKEIPSLILTNNLYGIEIDERAGALAAFALTMKARHKYRRFFRKSVQPNICVLQNVEFDDGEVKRYMDAVGRDLFTLNLQTTLHQFKEADNFGSLIRPDETNVQGVYQRIDSKGIGINLFLFDTHQKVLQVLKQTDYLSPKYHVVIANPPYMGGKGMNGRLGAWLKDNYGDVKSDLFSAFIVRNTELALPKGQLGFMSPFVWMFISSYEKLRRFLINQKTITSLVQLEYSGFDGATVPICTFTVENDHHPDFKGGYVRLSDFRGPENQGPRTLEAIRNPDCNWFFRASTTDFKKIPGIPIAYWVSESLRLTFDEGASFGDKYDSGGRLKTHNDEKYVRFVWEVALDKSKKEWCELSHGGDFRRWYGNRLRVVKWTDSSHKEYASHGGLHNPKFWKKIGATCSKITSSTNAFRIKSEDQEFSSLAPTIIPKSGEIGDVYKALSILNSKITQQLLWIINPSMTVNVGDLLALPIFKKAHVSQNDVASLISMAKEDWDAYETSCNFTCLSLLQSDYRHTSLKATYQRLRAYWQEITLKMQLIEEKNNRTFIEAYHLQDELTPEVPLNEITLTCNPHYRYSCKKSLEKLDELLLADTMKEFVSYAVGSMFGRYSLDRPGLILANQGEEVDDYLAQIPKPTFEPDDDNVIPILDGEWFIDDIAGRFRKFLKVTFGEEQYDKNLIFLEKAIGKDIRKYFLKDFYADHVKRYKKRPIYWQFSSPKGSFNVLIYMHRYRPDTVSIILNDYLREFSTKLISRREHLESISISASASTTEKTKALKEIEKLKKTITELDEYERDILYPLATQKIEIDLDDGVKVNYPKFGKVLKTVPGLS